MDGIFNIVEGTELWLAWFHVAGAAVELVPLDQQNVASAVCCLQPLVIGVVVDLEADVPGDSHMAAEAPPLMSVEIHVRHLDEFSVGFGNGGGQDQGVEAVFTQVDGRPLQCRALIAGLVDVVEA